MKYLIEMSGEGLEADGAFISKGQTCGVLLRAVLYDSLEVVTLLLDSHFSTEDADGSGRTALAHAASEGFDAMVRLLVDRGASLRQQVPP